MPLKRTPSKDFRYNVFYFSGTWLCGFWNPSCRGVWCLLCHFNNSMLPGGHPWSSHIDDKWVNSELLGGFKHGCYVPFHIDKGCHPSHWPTICFKMVKTCYNHQPEKFKTQLTASMLVLGTFQCSHTSLRHLALRHRRLRLQQQPKADHRRSCRGFKSGAVSEAWPA